MYSTHILLHLFFDSNIFWLAFACAYLVLSKAVVAVVCPILVTSILMPLRSISGDNSESDFIFCFLQVEYVYNAIQMLSFELFFFPLLHTISGELPLPSAILTMR